MAIGLALSIVLASISIDASDPWDGMAEAKRAAYPAQRLRVDIDDPWSDVRPALDAIDPWDQSVLVAAKPPARPRLDTDDPWTHLQ